MRIPLEIPDVIFDEVRSRAVDVTAYWRDECYPERVVPRSLTLEKTRAAIAKALAYRSVWLVPMLAGLVDDETVDVIAQFAILDEVRFS